MAKRQKTLVPEGFREDLPLHVQVMIGGIAVGIPYNIEGNEDTALEWRSFLTMEQAWKFIAKVAHQTERILLKAERLEVEDDDEDGS